MNVTHKLKIDLQKKTMYPEIDVVQGDAYSRFLEISLYSGPAVWNVPEGALVAIRYCKEDHTYGYYDTMPDGALAWSIHDNVVTVQLTPQMLTTHGIVLTQIELLCDTKVLATFAFRIRVEENAAAGKLRSETYVNWLEWMKQELAEYVKNGNFTGPPGPAGPVAELIHCITEYQVSDFGTTAPEGSWTADIPQVPQGKYLWCRTSQTYNNGDTAEIFTVSRFGVDGTGSVVSVSGVSPDENGNVPLAASDVNAFPITGGTLAGPLHMNGNTVTGLTFPVNATDAVSKSSLLDLVYPIGSIYQTTKSTSPASLFGGTWTQIKDTFLLAVGDNYSSGDTGGSETHTLTVEELAAHKHTQGTVLQGDAFGNMTTPANGVALVNGTGAQYYDAGTIIQGSEAAMMNECATAGGGAPHNNMPPYLAVYMWQRIA